MKKTEFELSRPQVIGINQIVWDPASLTLFAESNDHLDEDSNYPWSSPRACMMRTGSRLRHRRRFQSLSMAMAMLMAKATTGC